MGQPFISEIRIMAFNFPPRGWAFCSGQLMPISQNTALFAAIGTIYGGDGRSTFALPDLRGRVPIHRGNGFAVGQKGGEPTHTLSIGELPTHAHGLQATTLVADTSIPNEGLLASASGVYTGASNVISLVSATVGQAGASQPHQNMQPYLVLNFCICIGLFFPSPP